MRSVRRNLILLLSALGVVGLGLLTWILASRAWERTAGDSGGILPPAGSELAAATPSVWQALLRTTPFAYASPLPDPQPARWHVCQAGSFLAAVVGVPTLRGLSTCRRHLEAESRSRGPAHLLRGHGLEEHCILRGLRRSSAHLQ